MTSPDPGWLRDMLQSAMLAVRYGESLTLSDFMSDLRTQDAVLWRLAVIGEAANNVSEDTRNALSLEWSEIIGMRHVVIHHYRKLVMPRIWSTVQEDLPRLIATLETHVDNR